MSKATLRTQLRQLVVESVPKLNTQEVLDVTKCLENMIDDWLSASAGYRENVLQVYRRAALADDVKLPKRGKISTWKDLQTLLENMRKVKVVFDSADEKPGSPTGGKIGSSKGPPSVFSPEKALEAPRGNPKGAVRRS